ncbi:hypothetical protein FKW77_007932 [Venturia effusa]|uniref:Uncharacterized protein n=1 Tax=Venturia effusa TaxID=50376 RepID=A0A517LKK9_9PEZI|nr:hypothetical protein FKW77_007932 [Venturia effusa]
MLVCSSVAAPIEKRQKLTDHAIVAGVLNGMTQGIRRTHSDIDIWRGDQKGANLVVDDSEYLYRDMLEGTRIVGRTNSVSTWDTASMLAPANGLKAALEAMMDALVRKKRQIERMNYTPVVRSQLLKIRDSADALAKTCFSKLPAAAVLVARPVGNLITAKIDKGINSFPMSNQGSGSWWPSSQGNQPASTVSGPSPYRNDPLPPPQPQRQGNTGQGRPQDQAFGPTPQWGSNGWGQPQNQGFGPPPTQNPGWGRG